MKGGAYECREVAVGVTELEVALVKSGFIYEKRTGALEKRGLAVDKSVLLM